MRCDCFNSLGRVWDTIAGAGGEDADGDDRVKSRGHERPDNLECGVDDGALKALLWDGSGASATEFELAKRVDTYGRGRVCISYYTLQAQGGTPRHIPNLHIYA
jgi:hypothetical protein